LAVPPRGRAGPPDGWEHCSSPAHTGICPKCGAPLNPAPSSASGHLEALRTAEEGSVGVGRPAARAAPRPEPWEYKGDGILTLAFKGAFLFVCGGWHMEDFEIPWCAKAFLPFVEKTIHFGYMFVFSLIGLFFLFVFSGRT